MEGYDEIEDEYDEDQYEPPNNYHDLTAAMGWGRVNTARLAKVIDALYNVADSESEIYTAINELVELSESLSTALLECDAAILGLIGHDEELPPDDGTDLEASVLRDLANLDNVPDDVLSVARLMKATNDLHRQGYVQD